MLGLQLVLWDALGAVVAVGRCYGCADTTVAVVGCWGLLLSYAGTTIAVSEFGKNSLCCEIRGLQRHLWNTGPTVVVGRRVYSCCYWMHRLKLMLWDARTIIAVVGELKVQLLFYCRMLGLQSLLWDEGVTFVAVGYGTTVTVVGC
jgi:hypothetical protein